jgi:hypothetical protein
MHARMLVPVLLVPAMLAGAGCRFSTHHVTVQEPMTWACAPDRATTDYPEAQPVRLWFVESPAYEEVVFGKRLCDALIDSKKVVPVEFEAWGNSYRGLVGYRVVSIDGQKVVYVGGFGTSSVTGRPGPHPLSSHFK